MESGKGGRMIKRFFSFSFQAEKNKANLLKLRKVIIESEGTNY